MPKAEVGQVPEAPKQELPNAQKAENVIIPIGLRNVIVDILATKVVNGIPFSEMQKILQALQQAQPVVVQEQK
jgi:hypothetical protein